jgi:hypothetical protein
MEHFPSGSTRKSRKWHSAPGRFTILHEERENILSGGGFVRFAFEFIPFRFALLSCAIYMVFLIVIALAAVIASAGRDWAISGPRWFWLTLNAAIFFAGSALAWKIIWPHFPQ